MKVSDIIGGESERKVIHLLNHLKKKKKTNPKANKTGPMSNWIDVFGGMGGYKSNPTDVSNDHIQ